MHEKRLVYRIYKYWQYLYKRNNNKIPNISDFDNRIISDIKPFCINLKVNYISDDINMKYIWLGDMIAQNYQTQSNIVNYQDFADNIACGKIIFEIDKQIKANNFNNIIESEESKQLEDGSIIKSRSCAVPFYNSEEELVSNIIIGTSWKKL